MDIDLPKLKQAAAHVFGPTPVFLAYAYGSRVKGRPRADSDLDVGLCLPAGTPPMSLLELCGLEANLARAVGHQVDLHDLGQTSLEFRGIVLESGLRIYCTDETARVDFERDTLVRYLDMKPQLEELYRTQLRRMAREGLTHG